MNGDTTDRAADEREDGVLLALAWARYRTTLGTTPNYKTRRQEHRAFTAGWEAAHNHRRTPS